MPRLSSRSMRNIAVGFFLTAATASSAHHPGDGIDAAISAREADFRIVDAPALNFELADENGDVVRLSERADEVVVLNFVSADCGGCNAQTELLAEAHAMLAASPMAQSVHFLTVSLGTHDGAAAAHDWPILRTRAGDPPEAAHLLARAYVLDPEMIDEPWTVVIDRGNRLAGMFKGVRFDPVNIVLYVNGLLQHPPTPLPERGQDGSSWWESLTR
jgi:protein SCO1